MNKIFKVVWSKSKECYVVVSEVAKNNSGKKKVLASVLAGLAASGAIGGVAPQVAHANVDTNNKINIYADGQTSTPISIGNRVNTGTETVGLGNDVDTKGEYSIGIGKNAKTEGKQSIVIGQGARTIDTVANGSTSNTGGQAIAIGASANANSRSVAIGRNSNAFTKYGVAIGDSAVSRVTTYGTGDSSDYDAHYNQYVNPDNQHYRKLVESNGKFAVSTTEDNGGNKYAEDGVRTNFDDSTGGAGVAVGAGTKAIDFATVVGNKSYGMNSSVVLGSYNEGSGASTISIGQNTRASANFAQAYGRQASAVTDGSVAMGSLARGGSNTADNSKASDNKAAGGSVAVGTAAWATGNRAIAIGGIRATQENLEHPTGKTTNIDGTERTTGTDFNTQAGGEQAIAIGAGAQAAQNNSIAQGTNATIGVTNPNGPYNTPMPNYTYTSTDSDGNTIDKTATVSYAKGTSTDTVKYNAGSSIAIGDASRVFGATSGLALGTGAGVDRGAHFGIAIGDGALVTTTGTNNYASDGIAIGHAAVANAREAIAIGSHANAPVGAIRSVNIGQNSAGGGVDSVSLGTFAKANENASVALGVNSYTETRTGIEKVAYDQTSRKARQYQGNGANPNNTNMGLFKGEYQSGQVSVGGYGDYRQITNVQGGRDDHDAVNVAQLKNVSLAVGADVNNNANAKASDMLLYNGQLNIKGDSNRISTTTTNNTNGTDVDVNVNFDYTGLVKAGNGTTVTETKDSTGKTVFTVNAENAGSIHIRPTSTTRNGESANAAAYKYDTATQSVVMNYNDGQGNQITDASAKIDLSDLINDVKSKERHITPGTYNVDNNGKVTMTYTDGNGNVVTGEQAVIEGIAKSDLSNITDNGKKVITGLGTKVAAGDNVTVTSQDDANGTTTYTVNAKLAKIENGKNTTITGDGTANNPYHVDVKGDLDSITSITNNAGDGKISFGGNQTVTIAGDKAINLNGKTGDITGLSNITLNAPDFATKGRAATEEQLKLVNDGFNNTVGLGADGSTATNLQALNRQGGIKFNILGDGTGAAGANQYIKTTAAGDNVNVDLTDDAKNKLNKTYNVTSNDGTVTVNQSVNGDVTTFDLHVKPGEAASVWNLKSTATDGNVATGSATSEANISDKKTVNMVAGKNLTVKQTNTADGADVEFALDKDINVDTIVVNGKDGKDGAIGLKGADGVTRNISIQVPGTNGVDGRPGVDGTTTTRLIVDNKPQANLDDGLKFKGDDTTVIAKKLNTQMDIVGGANRADLTDGNIGVNSDNGALKVQLSKNLSGITNISNGGTTINLNDVTPGSNQPAVTIKGGNVSVDGNQIKNVKDGVDGKDAVNVDQLNQVKAAERHIKPTTAGNEYSVDNNGNVRMTYVDGNGNDVVGEEAVIKGIAKSDLTNITDGGKTVIQNLAKDAIDMEDGKNTKASNRDVNGVKTFKVDVEGDLAGITSITNTVGGPTLSFGPNSVNITGGNLNMNNNQIKNVKDGVDGKDAVNVDQLKGARTVVTSVNGSVNITKSENGNQITYDLAVDPKSGTGSTWTAKTSAGEGKHVGDSAQVIANSKSVDFQAGKNLTVTQTNDGDGNTAINYSLDKDIDVDTIVVNGKDGKDGAIGLKGADGVTRNISIQVPGTNGVDGRPGVDGTTTTRLIVDNKPQANLDDGLKFKGDDSTVIAKKLNTQLDIVGGANVADLTDGNIGVNSDNGALKIQLSKNLNNITNISNGGTTINLNDVTPGSNQPAVTIKGGDVSVDGNQIKNVKDGVDGKDAVNVDQLNQVKAAERHIKPTTAGNEYSVDNNGNVRMTYVDGNGNDVVGEEAVIKGIAKSDLTNITDGGKTVIQNLAKDAIDMEDGKNTKASNRDVNGVKTFKVDVEGDLENITSITNNAGDGKISFGGNQTVTIAGDKAINLNGKTGDITGLSNVTLNAPDFATQGRAATEEQLKLVNDGFNNTVGLGADGSTATNLQALNRQGGIKFNILGDGTGAAGANQYIKTTAAGDNVNVDLTDDAKNKLNKSYNVTSNDGTVTVNQSVNGDVTTFDLHVKPGEAASVWNLKSTATDGNVATGSATSEANISDKKTVNMVAGKNLTVKQTNTADGADVEFALDKDINVDTIVVNGKDGKDGAIGLKGADGVTRNISIQVPGTPGADGRPGVDGTTTTRLIVDNKPQANLDDGLKFGGDMGTTAAVKLNKQVDVKGGVTNAADLATGNNIGITSVPDAATGNATLNVQLAKDLTGLTSITNTVGGPTLNFGPNNINITGGNLDMGNNNIKNVKDGVDGKDAVNVDQLKGARTVVTSVNGSVNITKSENGNQITYDLAVDPKSGTGTTWTAKTSAGEGTHSGDSTQVIANSKTVDFQAGKNIVVTQTNDADGNTVINTALSDDITVGKDGVNGVDGKIGVNGKDGSSVVINGKDGSIGLNGKDGANGISIKGDKGVDGVDGANGANGITRIVYTDDQNNKREVATMDDGLRFTGNNTDTENKQKLNTLVKVQGEGVTAAESAAFTSAAGNINVKADGTDTLQIQLNKNIKGLDSVTTKEIKLGDDTNNVSIKKDGDRITYTTDGGTTIHKVANTTDETHITDTTYQVGNDGKVTMTYTDGEGNIVAGKTAVIEGIAKSDLTNITDGGKTVIQNLAKDAIDMEDGKNTKASNRDVNGVKTFKVDVEGDLENITSITNNVGDGKIAFGGNQTVTIAGDKAINLNGKTGDITGLSNVTLNAPDFATQGRAATEEQLKLVNDGFNNTVGLGADGSTATNLQALNRQGGIKFNILGDGTGAAGANQYIKTTAAGDNVNVDLTDDAKNKLNKSYNVVSNDGTVTVNQSVNGDVTTFDLHVKPADAKSTWNVKSTGNTTADSDSTTKAIADSNTVEMVGGKNVTVKQTNTTDGASIEFGLAKDIDVDAIVINGKDGKDGAIGLKGADGVTRNISIQVPGTNGVDGRPGVDGTTTTRLIVDNKPQANLDDGLKFKGDDSTVIAKKLNTQLDIVGGANVADLTDGNIGVNSDNGALKVQLSKNLSGITNISNGGTTINLNDVTPGSNQPAVTIKGGNVSVDGNQIKNVKDGVDGKDAVNVDQLNQVKAAEKHITPGTYNVDNNGKVTMTYTDGNGNIVNGETAVIEGIAKSDLSNITDGGKKVITDLGTKVAAGNNVTVTDTTDANGTKTYTINAKDTKVEAGDNITVDTTDNGNGVTTYKISAKGVNLGDAMLKYRANGSNEQSVKVSEGLNFVDGNYTRASVDANGQVKYDVTIGQVKNGVDGRPGVDGQDGIATVKTVVDTINNSGWKANATGNLAENTTSTSTIVKPGTTVNFDGGKNLTVEQKIDANGDQTYSYALNKDIKDMNTIKGGDNSSTITFTDKTTNDGNGVVISGGNVSVDGNKVTNVQNGAINATSKDAVNGSQLHQVISSEKHIKPDNYSVDNNGNVTLKYENGLGQETGETTVISGIAKNDLSNITNEGKKVITGLGTVVEAGDNITVETTTDDTTGQKTYKINAKSVNLGDAELKYRANGSNEQSVKVSQGLDFVDGNYTKASVDANGQVKYDVTIGNGTVGKDGKAGIDGKDGIATVKTVVDTINNSGWMGNATGNVVGNSTETIVKPGTTVNFDAGKNLTVEQRVDANGNHTYSYALADDITIGQNGRDGRDGVDGRIGVNGKDGSAVVINGKDGSIGLNGKDGANGISIKGQDGKVGVDGKDGETRMVYVEKNNPGKTHEIATTDDGLHFGGDMGNVQSVKLNKQVDIKGGVTDANQLAKGNNVGITATPGENGNATLNVQLNKDLQGINSITNGNTSVTFNANPSNGGQDRDPVVPAMTINGGNLSMSGNRITDVANGINKSDAATVGQLTQVTSNDQSVKITESTNADGARVYDLAVQGGVDPRVDQLSQEIGRVGAQSAALSALKPIQYDPLEPTQIMAGYGNYRGNSAMALGVAHYKNESTMIHGGVSWAGGSSHMMMNAGVTWKVGSRDSEAAVADRYRKGPVSSTYAMQTEMAAMKAQNAGLKGEVTDLKTENDQIKAQNAGLQSEVDQLKAQMAAMMARLGM